jgi:hypothetical protein
MSSTETNPHRAGPSRSLLTVTALILVGVGCNEPLGPLIPTQWGLITLDHLTTSGTDYTRPQALFYSSSSSPSLSGRGVSDVCGIFEYPSPPSTETIDEISAGERITLNVQGTQYSLVPTQIGSRRPYSLPEPGIAYRPGDSVVAEIPGAADGFPQMTIRGRTAEPFTLGPVETVSDGTFSVTWSPAGDDSSRMVVSLQYHDDLNPRTGLNAQVFCTFLDDGAGTVQPLTVRGWTSATGARRVQAVRWRSVLENKDDARLYLVSTYTVTKTSFP